MAIINLPQIDANDRQQYVANARSGAWCRYTGWDAKCFAVNPGTNRLYYGTSDGRVMRAESGGTDDGSLYSGKVVFSYDDFGVGPARKQMKAIRPLFRTTYNVNPTIEVLVDFDTDSGPAPSAAPENLSGALWDAAVWDTTTWPGTSSQRASWRSVTGFGSVVAPCMQVTISSDTDPDLRLQQMDVLYELGEALG
jgi:hypothetical protein